MKKIWRKNKLAKADKDDTAIWEEDHEIREVPAINDQKKYAPASWEDPTDGTTAIYRAQQAEPLCSSLCRLLKGEHMRHKTAMAGRWKIKLTVQVKHCQLDDNDVI